jgi:hypothetical protein
MTGWTDFLHELPDPQQQLAVAGLEQLLEQVEVGVRDGGPAGACHASSPSG